MRRHAIFVTWEGPLRFSDACRASGHGIYLCWGRNRLGRAPGEAKLLYVGISTRQDGVGVRVGHHANEGYAHPDNDWWIGRIVSPVPSTRTHYEAAEWMFVYFGAAEHNKRKVLNPPKSACLVVSEWTKGGQEYQRQTGAAGWLPDVFSWSPVDSKLRFAEKMRTLEF